MWTWNDDKDTLSPALFPTKALLEGKNKNMIVYKNLGLKQQKFEYDQINKLWQNENSQNVFEVNKGQVVDGANVITA